ncbi:MAG: hypothetical protein ABWY56_09535 [Propionibacteriaceae bacterium]
MIVFLLRAVIFITSAALGLLVTSFLVDGFHLSASGFGITVIVFAVIQSVLAPFIGMIAQRHASAFLGGVGIVSTFVALLVAHSFTGALQISGTSAWVLSTFLVWLVTAAATMLLPMVMFRKALRGRRTERIKRA